MSNDTGLKTGVTGKDAASALLTVSPAAIIAVSIAWLGFHVQKSGMNVFELTDAIYEKYYPVILTLYIVVLPAFFPFVIKHFKTRGISLFQEITSKKTLFRDLTFGVLAGICSFIFVFVDTHVVLKMPVEKTGNLLLIVPEIISLVIVSGFFKEIYFRGIPYLLMKSNYGELKSFLFGNICFTILDWPNYGLSFFLGLIWYLFYRKNGSLLIPIVGHGLCNLLGILARCGALGFIGIIPVESI